MIRTPLKTIPLVPDAGILLKDQHVSHYAVRQMLRNKPCTELLLAARCMTDTGMCSTWALDALLTVTDAVRDPCGRTTLTAYLMKLRETSFSSITTAGELLFTWTPDRAGHTITLTSTRAGRYGQKNYHHHFFHTFSHLADAFIQSYLQMRTIEAIKINIISVDIDNYHDRRQIFISF